MSKANETVKGQNTYSSPSFVRGLIWSTKFFNRNKVGRIGHQVVWAWHDLDWEDMTDETAVAIMVTANKTEVDIS